MFMKGSIRYRLMLLMIVLTTAPVLIVTLIATNNTRSSVEKEMIEANRSRMLWAEQYLDELVSQIDVLFYSLQINQPLMDGLAAAGEPTVSEQFRTQRYIQETLTSAFYANSRKIDELSLYTHQSGRIYSVNFGTSGLIHSLDIRSGAWSRMLDGPVSLYFKQSGDHMYAFHSVNRFEDRALLGGLAVRINDGVWRQVGDILRSEPDSAVFLMNDEGELLAGSSMEAAFGDALDRFRESLRQDDGAEPFRKTDRYFLFAERVDGGTLILLKAVPITAVTESADDTVRAGLLAGVFFAALSVLASIVVSLRITRPIVALAKTMRTAPIQQFEMTSVRSRDEIGLLERGYNSMMQRIKELIEHEYRREIEVKNAQLMALQAQINPHFLNNALILIGGMALSKGMPDVYRIAQGIGDLLRYSIGSGEELASLEDEAKHVRNYLFIQEQRFAGRCTVAFSAEPGPAAGVRLPRFTLQPLVENAFEHGLQPKEGAWEIEIRVKRIGRHVAVLLRDNGVGMDGERLRALRDELRLGAALRRRPNEEAKAEPARRKGIGLANVDSRMKLHFGGRGIRLYSGAGAGTIVALQIPIVQEQEANSHDKTRGHH
ncbi:sensor histidine kinase [Paenibacillus sp.]|uniref:sensor histidine kinase n=1 Tax=Paenibacillus sp. TaxID=58172 RepID=UPI002D3D60DF|nr:sensor histidine kinase [Paenibacillus sp.]HZG86873.1 sensor histidine kinase [Paenibacillus sp.]